MFNTKALTFMVNISHTAYYNRMKSKLIHLTHKNWSFMRVWFTRRSSWEEKQNDKVVNKPIIQQEGKENKGYMLSRTNLNRNNLLASIHILAFKWPKVSQLRLIMQSSTQEAILILDYWREKKVEHNEGLAMPE